MVRAKILVIEDGQTYAELATMLLEKLGYKVTLARRAEDGIRVAQEEAPDLILMDLNLPGMGGLEAIRILKADSRTRDIPTIAMTTDCDWEDGEPARAREAGFEALIEKPIDKAGFRALVGPFVRP